MNKHQLISLLLVGKSITQQKSKTKDGNSPDCTNALNSRFKGVSEIHVFLYVNVLKTHSALTVGLLSDNIIDVLKEQPPFREAAL